MTAAAKEQEAEVVTAAAEEQEVQVVTAAAQEEEVEKPVPAMFALLEGAECWFAFQEVKRG